ncbi:SusC/RagA family TonB-linked outer membrane protein [Parafilimonas sp.]|uniref:SusC/RagA family TonB-linked outer membrane protein n=1 Tax=Parafilimonas sp. TaxID=1969739 RepID=UPI0039E3CD33
MNFYSSGSAVRERQGGITKILLVMKLTTLISLIACIQVSAAGFGQNITLNENKASLREVFNQIKKQSDYIFFYEEKALDNLPGISVHARDADITSVLRLCLKGLPLSFTISGNFIGIKRESTDTSGAEKTDYAIPPPVRLTGQVVDSAGSPVSYASVVIKGTKSGTATDNDGRFSLESSASSGTLIVSHIGYITQEVSFSGNMNLKITLLSRADVQKDVVVTALGIKKEKRALGYSVTEVKGEDLTEARSVNIANSLEGKVAGLNITGTATGPGGAQRITIRGDGSISGNNQPLIIVDGIPLNNDNLGNVQTYAGPTGGIDLGDGISSINPDEIATVSVLKGGTAAALYGSRASNGVILITTKGGAKRKGIGVEINSNYVVESLLYSRWKDFQYEYGSGVNGAPGTNLNDMAASWGGKLDGSLQTQYDGVQRPYVAQRDNLKNFYQTGGDFTNSVAISGGNDYIAYRASLSHLNTQSIVPNTTLKRDNFAVNLNAKLNKKISFLLNAKYISEANKNRPRLSDFTGNANFTVMALPTSLDVNIMKDKYDSLGYEKLWSTNPWETNPWYAQEDFREKDSKTRMIVSFESKAYITDWLYVKGRFGFDKFNFRENFIVPTGAAYLLGGQLRNELLDYSETNNELLLGFDKDVAGGLHISAFAGGNLMRQVYQQQNIVGSPFNIPFFYDISNISPASITTTDPYTEQRINSLYGSVDLSWKDYLFLNMTGRNDWFSTLSPQNNNIFYPSVGVSFVPSSAFKMPGFVSYLKLRGSWAQVGGATSPYQLNLNYALTGSYRGAALAQINQTQVPNAALQPLLSTSAEIGLETYMFSNRLKLDLALYSRITTNDIVSATLSATTGYTSALFNVGKLTNKGVELLLSYRVINGKDFSWEPSVNFAYNKNRVNKLTDGLDKLQVGASRIFTAYVYQEVGHPFSMLAGAGYVRDEKGNVVVNAQGYPEINSFVNFGTGISPFTGGFSNSFRYKFITLGVLIDGRFGGKIYAGTDAFAAINGMNIVTAAGGVRENGYVVPGVLEDGTLNTTSLPAQAFYTFDPLASAESYIYKSDFIKLRQIILDFALPARWYSNTPIQAISFGIVGRNLAILKKYTPNIDPESTYNASNAQGLELAGVPSVRTFGFNLNVKF